MIGTVGRGNWPRQDGENQVLAHTAAGTVLDPQPARGYRLTTSRTGTHASPNPMVAVTRSGTVFYSPATPNEMMGVDVARSRDGETWETVVTPRDPPYAPPDYEVSYPSELSPQAFGEMAADFAPGTTLHQRVYVDEAADRLFVTSMVKGAFADGSGAVLAYTDDDGETWSSTTVGEGTWDWGKLFAGPPATDASRAALEDHGYPSVLYYCATGPTFATGPNQAVFKSLDGGDSWTRAGEIFDDEAVSDVRFGYPGMGAVGPDGTLYRPWAGRPTDFVPGNSEDCPVFVVRSGDEGESWEQIRVPGTSTGTLDPDLAVDLDHELTLAWADAETGKLQVATSVDRGETWTKSLSISPPGVERVTKPAVTRTVDGTVALSYWGSATESASGDGWIAPDGRPYCGYLTLCPDPEIEDSVCWTTPVGDPGDPSLPQGESLLTSGEELGAPVVGPDGSIRAGFLDRRETVEGVVARLRRES